MFDDDEIAEKLTIGFDINKLREVFDQTTAELSPVLQGVTKQWGGWGIWTASGDWRDGFQEGAPVQETGDKRQPVRPIEHVNPTSICVGYLAEVLEVIRAEGLTPHRARYARLEPGARTGWHRDTNLIHYQARLHIPLYTNPECFFIQEKVEDDSSERVQKHLPADGSCYVVSPNRMHMAVNGGQTTRVHIICDIYDNIKYTKFHNFGFWHERKRIQAEKEIDHGQKST